jgi:hypothetical protein
VHEFRQQREGVVERLQLRDLGGGPSQARLIGMPNLFSDLPVAI